MLLFRGEVVLPDGLLEHPGLQAAAELFLAARSAPPPSSKLIYACQGEEATCAADEQAILGSSDATTCVIAVLVATTAPEGAPLLARITHHDETTVGSPTALQQTVAGMQAAQLWLAGGYADVRGVGPRVARRLLAFLHRCEARLQVRLCCVGALNTAPDGSPRCTALAVDLRSLAAHPAAPAPERRGPMAPARMAQWAYAQPPSASDRPDGSPLRSVYDAGRRQLALELLQGRPPGHFLWHCAQLLGLPDEGLLERWSTSPAHEPLHFAADVRASFQWLLEQSGPVFAATHRFAWRDGAGWLALEEAGVAAAAEVAGSLGERLALGGIQR